MGQQQMPRVRPRGVLERSAIANLFKHTLSRIPTAYGRLSYLGSLRDTNSGNYHHYGLFSTFGREESVRALQESHERQFREWLSLPVEAKHAALKAYLSSLEDTETTVLTNWTRSRIFHSYVPAGASEAERNDFCQEMELLLEVMNSDA